VLGTLLWVVLLGQQRTEGCRDAPDPNHSGIL